MNPRVAAVLLALGGCASLQPAQAAEVSLRRGEILILLDYGRLIPSGTSR